MDKVTQQRIAQLHPSVRQEVTNIISECDAALTGKAKVRITQGLRTMEEQRALYALGRTKPGKKVTNAVAGQSIHNYGFAVDICLIINGTEASWDTVKDWDNDTVADWFECVKIFAKYGWDWGGNWKRFKDLPHFDKKGCNSWKLLAIRRKDKEGYVILDPKELKFPKN
jgi:peptidoglycan LD-endopeptidase CwlK